MKILVLSFYYAPDLSAGSFRATALVRALADQIEPSDEIHVVTTQPNRYGSFNVQVPAVERAANVTIHRVALPPHESGMLDQSRAFIAFVRGALRLVRGEQYAVVVATSSRLMTAVLGSWIARRARAPLYLDIRDIFADTIKDVLPGLAGRAARIIFGRLERFAVRPAARVNLVSRGFAPYFAERYPRQSFAFFTNGIDDEFLEAAPLAPPAPGEPDAGRVPHVLYAGNVGEGQGLHEMVPLLAKRLEGRARFTIIGAGGRRRALAERIAALNVGNVELLPPMNREHLIEAYRSADVLFLHLNNHEAFLKVLPSKLFEYAATGKPIWAGVAGYAVDFIREHVANATVFAPCDVDAAYAQFGSLDLVWRPRDAFVREFARAAISRALAADVLRVAQLT